MDLMHGSHFAKQYVTDYLMNDIPGRLVTYRNGWGLDDIALPSPLEYLTYEPLALDAWPTIVTVAMSMSDMERTGFFRGDPEYRVNYSMRTYVWIRHERAEATTDMRDRLTTVVRSALLDHPRLKSEDPRMTFNVQIDEGTMSEQYSDLTLLKGDRVLAGSYISYNLYINEIVAREPIGTAEQFDLTFNAVGIAELIPE